MTTSERPDVLALLETYFDAAPRARSDVEEHGPLTLFVARGGWPYYARPRLGLGEPVQAADVSSVLARQRELGVPQALEWVHETTADMEGAVAAAGLTVERHPLLVLDGPPVVRASAAEVREVAADDLALGPVLAAISVGFGQAGTEIGEASVAERDTWVAREAGALEHTAQAVAAGLSVLFGAFDSDAGAVGGGSHNPRVIDGRGVTEVVGVGVLPAYRRRGIAAHLSGKLARHAVEAGIGTVFCSAASDDVARVYESVGFRRVGTACVAELP